MKKIIKLITVATIFLMIAGGCSKKDNIDNEDNATDNGKETISIGRMSIDYTNIEITDGTTGNIVLLNDGQSAELYNKIKDIEFEKEESSKGITGWSFSLKFMKDSIVMESISVISKDMLDYKDYFYKANSSGFDMEYLKSFFNSTFEAEVIEAGDSLLITPNEESNEYKSSDKMTVSLVGSKIKSIDGNDITMKELVAGDIIKITYNGVILESYPAQISASSIEVIGHNILID